MGETCDRCGDKVSAYTWWWRPEGRAELTLCAHHAREHEAALTAQRFLLARDDRAALLVPA